MRYRHCACYRGQSTPAAAAAADAAAAAATADNVFPDYPGSGAINTSAAQRPNTISKQYRTRKSHHTRMHRASKRQMASGNRMRPERPRAWVQLKTPVGYTHAQRPYMYRSLFQLNGHYYTLFVHV